MLRIGGAERLGSRQKFLRRLALKDSMSTGNASELLSRIVLAGICCLHFLAPGPQKSLHFTHFALLGACWARLPEAPLLQVLRNPSFNAQWPSYRPAQFCLGKNVVHQPPCRDCIGPSSSGDGKINMPSISGIQPVDAHHACRFPKALRSLHLQSFG